MRQGWSQPRGRRYHAVQQMSLRALVRALSLFRDLAQTPLPDDVHDRSLTCLSMCPALAIVLPWSSTSHPSGTKHQHQPPSTMLRLQPLGCRSLKLSFPVSLRLQRSQSRWTSRESRRIAYAHREPRDPAQHFVLGLPRCLWRRCVAADPRHSSALPLFPLSRLCPSDPHSLRPLPSFFPLVLPSGVLPLLPSESLSPPSSPSQRLPPRL